jgi:hypothetical protein
VTSPTTAQAGARDEIRTRSANDPRQRRRGARPARRVAPGFVENTTKFHARSQPQLTRRIVAFGRIERAMTRAFRRFRRTSADFQSDDLRGRHLEPIAEVYVIAGQIISQMTGNVPPGPPPQLCGALGSNRRPDPPAMTKEVIGR